MLTLIIPPAPADEAWDQDREEFVSIPSFRGARIQLEHSLISVSRWESKWHKSFSSTKSKTPEEFLDYVRCMTLTKAVPPEVYQHLTPENLKAIDAYIKDPMTATTFRRKPGQAPSRRVVTSEQIYSWMIDAEIPFEAEKWHLNRLLTLLEVRNNANTPGKKMSTRDIMKENAALNAARRAKMHTRG